MLHFGYNDMTEAVQDSVKTAEDTPSSELLQAGWSVISFEKLEGSGLLYHEAVSLLETLDQKGLAGLCITTDEAAGRIS